MAIRSILSAAAFALAATVAAGAHAHTFFVDARDDIFIAGQSSVPAGFPAQTLANSDPGAGFLPYALDVTAGQVLHLTATGLASCGVGCVPGGTGPDGDNEFGPASIAGYGNVGAYSGTGFELLGVYNAGSTPWTPFAIGSGGTFVVPTGATKLYFGLPDGFSFGGAPGTYNDNLGGFTVSSAPEPAIWSMMILGVAGIGAAMRRRRAAEVALTA
jgi:hypothetical protein